jgi:PAS domain S-box-containing protein
MPTDIAPDTALAIETELNAWRTRVLNALYIVTIISAAPLTIMNIANAIEDPRHWTGAIPYLAIYLVIIGLAVFRRLSLRLRAWGLVLLGYLAGALALALGGLAGDGRVFLLAMPMLALILIGVRPGMIAAFLSLLILAVFALTAHLGWMEDWLLITGNPLDLESWIYEGIVVALCLGLVTTLQRYLYLLLTTIAAERTQLLEAAQTSRVLYQIASELTSDFTYAISLESNGRFLGQDMSEAFTRITGYTLDEIGTPGKLADCVYPQDLPLFQQYVESVVSGESCTGEFRIRTKDGDVRWLRAHGQPMWDEAHEQVAQLYGAVQDITRRKEAEQALRQSEEMARAILNATTESVLLLDDHGAILDLNQTAAQRLGKGVDELVGLQPQDIVMRGLSPALVKSRVNWVREVVRTGKPVRFEDRRGGIAFDTQMYPISSVQGKVTRLAVFARDVTAQREAERRAGKAERLAAMGQLAAGLAHELNNPLQAIRSNLELVQDFDLEPDEQKARLNVIQHEIKRLAGLSQDVLDFARPPDDTRYPISLASLMNRTLALVNKQLQLARIQVTTDFPADLPSLPAVPGQIAQVLLNMTVNAIEAIGDGGHLEVTAGVEGDMLALAMTNDGPPITEEHMEHIFEPFFTTKPGGTGLGLSICHSIIQQHDGTISVENLEDDGGVTFTVRLPIVWLSKDEETSA